MNTNREEPGMTTITYRKTKTGQWVAFGPASAVKPGLVTITKKDGTTKTERVESVGKTFTANGETMVYGYLSPSSPSSAPRRRQDRPYVPAGQRRCRDCRGPIDPSLDGASYGAPGYCYDCA